MSVDVNDMRIKQRALERLQSLLDAMTETPRAIIAEDTGGGRDGYEPKMGILTDTRIIVADMTRVQAWKLEDIAKVTTNLGGSSFLSRGRLHQVYVVPNPGKYPDHVEMLRSLNRQVALEFAQALRQASTNAVLNGTS